MDPKLIQHHQYALNKGTTNLPLKYVIFFLPEILFEESEQYKMKLLYKLKHSKLIPESTSIYKCSPLFFIV